MSDLRESQIISLVCCDICDAHLNERCWNEPAGLPRNPHYARRQAASRKLADDASATETPPVDVPPSDTSAAAHSVALGLPAGPSSAQETVATTAGIHST